jgi:hypothetical protein
VESIRRWWYELGAARYPTARRLLITADCGGSNGVRVRLWKRELQVLGDKLRIAITVCHLPPGTSKWNRIEHRLFAFITHNWRGKPLVSHQVSVRIPMHPAHPYRSQAAQRSEVMAPSVPISSRPPF